MKIDRRARALGFLAVLAPALCAVRCGPDRSGFTEAGPRDASLEASLPDVESPADVTMDRASPPDAAAVCPTTGAEVSGRVTAPNGEDPVPGAVVYVTDARPPAQPAGVGCDACELPPGVRAFSVTDVRGRWSFVRGVAASGSMFLVVQKGRFRRVTPVELTACAPRVFDDQATRLPGTRAEGEIPAILVASGTSASQADRPSMGDWTYDDIARVIRRIGITEFDRAEPCRQATVGTDVTRVSCPFGGILADPARLARYSLVVAPCGALGFNRSWQVLDAPSNRTIAANVRAWLRQGGRLYTSDTAYGLLARSAPSVATFAGGTTLTQGRDPANLGVGAAPPNGRTYMGRVVDDGMRAWLTDRGALGPDGAIALSGFISPWVAIESVPSSTRTVVDAEVEWFTATAGVTMPAGRRPLAISADVREGGGCGRVVYSSYEVDNRSGAPTDPLTAQERVLEYMLFELGGCLTTPG